MSAGKPVSSRDVRRRVLWRPRSGGRLLLGRWRVGGRRLDRQDDVRVLGRTLGLARRALGVGERGAHVHAEGVNLILGRRRRTWVEVKVAVLKSRTLDFERFLKWWGRSNVPLLAAADACHSCYDNGVPSKCRFISFLDCLAQTTPPKTGRGPGRHRRRPPRPRAPAPPSTRTRMSGLSLSGGHLARAEPALVRRDDAVRALVEREVLPPVEV